MLQTNPPRLYSNLQFVQRWRNPLSLKSEAGCYFTHLQAATSFLDNLATEEQQRRHEAEGGPPPPPPPPLPPPGMPREEEGEEAEELRRRAVRRLLWRRRGRLRPAAAAAAAAAAPPPAARRDGLFQRGAHEAGKVAAPWELKAAPPQLWGDPEAT